jgi:hypothetical protein
VLNELRRAAATAASASSGTSVIVEGELTGSDEKDSVRKGSFRRVFPRQMVGGTLYLIKLVSSDFDAYLRLEDQDGKELAFDDDSGGNLNAQINFLAPRDGVFRIIATSYTEKATGKFVLTVLPVREILNTEGQLTQNDEKDTARTDSVRKTHSCQMSAGKYYVIDLRSDDFDSYLRLENDQGVEVAKDDDSGGFPHARITFRAPRDGVYRIIATTYKGGAFGRYTLRICEETAPLTSAP